jgi:hypothetical protein
MFSTLGIVPALMLVTGLVSSFGSVVALGVMLLGGSTD